MTFELNSFNKRIELEPSLYESLYISIPACRKNYFVSYLTKIGFLYIADTIIFHFYFSFLYFFEFYVVSIKRSNEWLKTLFRKGISNCTMFSIRRTIIPTPWFGAHVHIKLVLIIALLCIKMFKFHCLLSHRTQVCRPQEGRDDML